METTGCQLYLLINELIKKPRAWGKVMIYQRLTTFLLHLLEMYLLSIGLRRAPDSCLVKMKWDLFLARDVLENVHKAGS